MTNKISYERFAQFSDRRKLNIGGEVTMNGWEALVLLVIWILITIVVIASIMFTGTLNGLILFFIPLLITGFTLED